MQFAHRPGDVDYLNAEQCKLMLGWLEWRLTEPINPRLETIYRKLVEFANKAIELGTGIVFDLQHQMLPLTSALIATRPVSNSCDVPCLMAFSTIGCRVNAGNCCWDNSCGIAMLTCNATGSAPFQFADKRSHVQFRRRE